LKKSKYSRRAHKDTPLKKNAGPGSEIHSACSHAPLIKAINAYGLFLSNNKLLASDTDVALVAPEVSQMPAFVHRNRILACENKLRRNKNNNFMS